MQGFSPVYSSWSKGSAKRSKVLYACGLGLLFLLALYFRTSGLFRGLGDLGTIFHPDEPKQILALFNFLNGDYVRYYGSLFYDGYPYGLNHLDEYLLRPFFLLFNSETPTQYSLYYYARILRVLYGLLIVAIGSHLVYKLTESRLSSLLAALLLAISPLAITVTHFATGDIGVDLFCALCCLFLFFSLKKKHTTFWLLLTGVSVGAAFSAKYNGLLIAIIPGVTILLQLLRDKHPTSFLYRIVLLGTGALLGLFLFTPHLLLETKPSIINILANFAFIKNYQIPPDILNKPWHEKAILGLKLNTFKIIISLGKTLVVVSLLGLLWHWKRYTSKGIIQDAPLHSRDIYLISLAVFPFLVLLISLSGKYVVQPFHFSYLQVPIIITACVVFHQLYTARNIMLKGAAFFLVLLAVVESGSISIKDNFFWRLEDNNYHAQSLPASIYTKAALYTYTKDPIRSLHIENQGNSVFRNRRQFAEGPDAQLWNSIGIAPIPQVAHPIGKDWIFLNGATFPRNDKTVIIRGGAYEKTVKRYLVLPEGKEIAGLGIRCGSFSTEARITIGKQTIQISLDAHQQRIISLAPPTRPGTGNKTMLSPPVQIIPLQITIPHNALWVTILTTQKEVELFTLFGNNGNAYPTIPEILPPHLKRDYFEALTHLRYLENKQSRRINKNQSIPVWEVSLPAGRYRLICEIDGIAEKSTLSLYFKDAKDNAQRKQPQTILIKNGLQRVEYAFSKPFAPFQMQFVMEGIKGSFRIRNMKLVPDYISLHNDYEVWRTTGLQPCWLTPLVTKEQ